MNVGIYYIKNTVNNKIYIGQSRNIKVRLGKHRCTLKNKYNTNRHLQSSVDKHGLDAFEFGILEECSKDLLDSKEQEYIIKYNSTDREFGFNNESGGCKNKSHSEETKIRQSQVKLANDLIKNDKYLKHLSEKVNKNVKRKKQKIFYQLLEEPRTLKELCGVKN